MQTSTLTTQSQGLQGQIHLDRSGDGQHPGTFVVELRGRLLKPGEGRHIQAVIKIDDVTDGINHVRPVLEKRRRRGLTQAPVFSQRENLGYVDGHEGVEQWVPLARIDCDWLLFARKGRRSLLFQIDLVSCADGLVLSSVRALMDYQNPSLGYVDICENLQNARVLGLALATLIAGTAWSDPERSLGLLRGWVLADVDLKAVSLKGKRQFEKAFRRLLKQTRSTDCRVLKTIGQRLAQIAPPAVRLDLVQLTLELLKNCSLIDIEQLRQLRDAAGWLEIDEERFRTMLSKALPVVEHSIVDTSLLLGITDEMTPDQVRQRLNHEYAKWNARVTNPDPTIKAQADQMLDLIAATRARLESATAP